VGARKLKRSRPLEAEQEVGTRKLKSGPLEAEQEKGARKLKRSGPLEAEQEKGVRKLNRRKGEVGGWTGGRP
jgi:hypothetical protein